jgi:hypothetical protein
MQNTCHNSKLLLKIRFESKCHHSNNPGNSFWNHSLYRLVDSIESKGFMIIENKFLACQIIKLLDNDKDFSQEKNCLLRLKQIIILFEKGREKAKPPEE